MATFFTSNDLYLIPKWNLSIGAMHCAPFAPPNVLNELTALTVTALTVPGTLLRIDFQKTQTEAGSAWHRNAMNWR